MKAACLAALLVVAAACGGQRPASPLGTAPAATPAAAPTLIVVIAVDQFSADLFAQYRPYFAGGLRRLSDGVVFTDGYQSHNATETCPGHSTILTGSRPARTGIIANDWFNLDVARGNPSRYCESRKIYCAEDEHVAGSTHGNFTPSTFHLRVPTLGDHMKGEQNMRGLSSVLGTRRPELVAQSS